MLIKVPVSWLREYVDINVPIDELALKLHMSSTEVKGIERPWWDDKIRVARVEKLAKHPNADKLLLATVDYGAGSTKTVVTGAPNLTEGAIVPYGDEGATVIDGHTGERATLRGKPMRGIKSEGMVLSRRELGLGDDHEGIYILDSKLPIGALLREVLGETVLSLELQPNRPDCLGVVGIAREVAAVLGTSLREPPGERLGPSTPKDLDVRIEDESACRRFAAALLTGVQIGPSPEWMQARLVAAGMRPIANVVDITNYVMLELGQPLHAYDHRKLRGGALVARQARRGESIRTLDGIDRVLPEGALVIADAERALGVAGILGGEDSEIRDDTTTVALECASFEPRGIGRTATKLGLHGSSGSAAARRFSWELSPELVPIALARACRLLREHAGAKVEGVVDRNPNPRQRVNVRMRFSDVPRVMGIEIDPAETLDILRRLQFTAAADGDTLVATPPIVRTDIAIAEDIVEEVGRIAGYERLPTRIPDGPLPLAERHPLEEFRERARDGLAGFGLQEIVSYSLIDPAWLKQLTADGSCVAAEPLRVINPTTVAQSVARPTLRASLLDTARRNLRHRASVAIFEIAPVYLPKGADLPEERWTIEILLAGNARPVKDGETWLTPERPFDVRDLQGIVAGLEDLLDVRLSGDRHDTRGLHPGRSIALARGDRTYLTVGQIDPRVAETWELPPATFIAEIDLAIWQAAARPTRVAAPPRFPPALRDLAVVVDEAAAYGDLEREIRAAAGKDLESVALLDLYRGQQAGAGKKSFAVRLTFRSGSGTLAEADVERLVKRVAGRLQHTLGAAIRD
ncbi:MAG TPA: phenylalanine--tRNA ligase subunit beta [Candidatus Polarisedimenticolia bacterium]|nr:phenylalanine--tRNA ligase subunit beta [Candidatus Polarisedimenticolia bacterium]